MYRQRDAHTWVEVLLKGLGWAPFDPTPEAGTAPPPSSSGISLWIDSLRVKWARYVINYSFADQVSIGMGMEQKGRALQKALKDAFAYLLGKGAVTGKNPALLILLVSAIILILALAARVRKNRPKDAKTPEFYDEMLKTLRKRGFERTPPETHLEFAKRTGLPEALELTVIFNSIRYGGSGLADVTRAGALGSLGGVYG